MAKASSKNRKPTKRLNPSKFSIVEAITEDASRYVAAFSRLVYSYEVIKDKKNTEQVKQIEISNLEVQRQAREFAQATEEEFFKILDDNVKVFFLVKDSLDCGFAIVEFNDDNMVYISNFTVFRHLIGMGSMFYNMLEAYLKNYGITKITLKSMFEGSNRFWKKMGFILDAGSRTKYHKFL